MKNLKREEQQSSEVWLTEKRMAIADALDLSGMRIDSIMAVLHGLKTVEMQNEMLRGWLEHYDRTGKYPTADQAMMAMVSIRQTGVYSHGEFETEEETR